MGRRKSVRHQELAHVDLSTENGRNAHGGA